MVFGLDDGLATSFSWNTLWWAVGFVGTIGLGAVQRARTRVEIANGVVYERSWTWGKCRYAIEAIDRIEKDGACVILVLKDGKKIELPEHLERPDKLDELLQHMLEHDRNA